MTSPDTLLASPWDPLKHPRGRDGRFIEVGSLIRFFFGADLDNGIVREINPDGTLRVARNDGGVVKVRPGDVLEVDTPKAHLHTVHPTPWASRLEASFLAPDADKRAEIDAFDALDPDTEVTLFHGTTADNAAAIERDGRAGYTPRGDEISGIAGHHGMYVAPTFKDAAPYAGPDGEVVEFTARRGDVVPSPESRDKTVGRALFDSFEGAVLTDGAPLVVKSRRPSDPDTVAQLPGLEPAVSRLDDIKPEGAVRQLSDRQVQARARRVINSVGEYLGKDLSHVQVLDEPSFEGTARWIGKSTDGQERDVNMMLLNSRGVIPRLKDPEIGPEEWRKISHEAMHAGSGSEHTYQGYSHDYEEGGAEILSLDHWLRYGPAADPRDAVRIDGQWVTGDEATIRRSVYKDEVNDFITRAASKVGWDRDAVLAEVRRVFLGEGDERLEFRDSTDPDAVPPFPIEDEDSLLRWLMLPEADTVAQLPALEPTDNGPWYHGTNQALAPGSVLDGSRAGVNFPGAQGQVYITQSPGLARAAATMAVDQHGGEPHVYRVEPQGNLSVDPEFGDSTRSSMTPSATVVEEDVPLPSVEPPDTGDITARINVLQELDDPPDELMALYAKRRNVKHDWEKEIVAAIASGKITPEGAYKRWRYPDGSGSKADGAAETFLGSRDWQELPPKLYHVTTAAGPVRESGVLKSRRALEQGGLGNGLGGGSDESVSFTDDPEIAQEIRRAMLEAADAASGRKTIQNMMDDAAAGTGANQPFLNDMMEFYSHHWAPGDPYPEGLQRLLDKPETTPSERLDFYKHFAVMRQLRGGPMDPLFFGSSADAIAKLTPEDVAVIEVEPPPGTYGVRMGALGEIRLPGWNGIPIAGEHLDEGTTALLPALAPAVALDAEPHYDRPAAAPEGVTVMDGWDDTEHGFYVRTRGETGYPVEVPDGVINEYQKVEPYIQALAYRSPDDDLLGKPRQRGMHLVTWSELERSNAVGLYGNGGQIDVAIDIDGEQRKPEDIVATLVHEATHAWWFEHATPEQQHRASEMWMGLSGAKKGERDFHRRNTTSEWDYAASDREEFFPELVMYAVTDPDVVARGVGHYAGWDPNEIDKLVGEAVGDPEFHNVRDALMPKEDTTALLPALEPATRVTKRESGQLIPVMPPADKPGPAINLTNDGIPEEIQAKEAATWAKFTGGLTFDDAEANLQAMFDDAMANDPDAVASGRDWYQRQQNDILAAADRFGLDHDTAIAATAALSPGLRWEMNLVNAIKLFQASVEHPELDSKELAVFIQAGQGAEKMSLPYGWEPLFVATRIMRGEDLDATLTGPKRRSFFNNLRDPDDPLDVTIDSHMMDASKGGLIPGPKALFIDTPRNKIIDRMYRKLGWIKTGRTWSRPPDQPDLPEPTLPKDWEPKLPPGADFEVWKGLSPLTGTPKYMNNSIGVIPALADNVRRIAANWSTLHPEDPLTPLQVQAIIWEHQITLHPYVESREATNSAIDATADFYLAEMAVPV